MPLRHPDGLPLLHTSTRLLCRAHSVKVPTAPSGRIGLVFASPLVPGSVEDGERREVEARLARCRSESHGRTEHPGALTVASDRS